MGDPRKVRKKYQGPSHPWQKERIDIEKALMREYGFGNKKELWKMESRLRTFKIQAKRLIAAEGKQSELEKQQLMRKLQSIGLITATARLDDILELTLKHILDRRLQTLLYKNNFAHSIKQARQFITHHHVAIAGKKITSPSYLVGIDEEPKIYFADSSTLANEGHPERVQPEEPTVTTQTTIEPAKKAPAKDKPKAAKEDKKAEKTKAEKKAKKPVKKVKTKAEKTAVKEETKEEPAEKKETKKEETQDNDIKPDKKRN